MFISPTLMNRDCAGPWYLHGSSSVFMNPRMHCGCAAPNCRTIPGVFIARERHLCHSIMQTVGESLCWSVRDAHLGWDRTVPWGQILGLRMARQCWGSHCPHATSQSCESKIKSMYWISAVGGLHYRSNRMILSQLYLELRIANAKR